MTPFLRRAGAASGGQVQRAAVARALVHAPTVVFADEPTGALDSVTGELVLEAMVATARNLGSAVLLVTHEAVVPPTPRGRSSCETAGWTA